MDADLIIASLREQDGVALGDLPASSGLYALRDHTRAIRYFGIAHSEGFRTRIFNRHTTGSEDHSHKFSAAYNVGRLWRDRHEGVKEDGAISKKLRNHFIRRHCSASYFELTNYDSKARLEWMESKVIALAEPGETIWNRKFKASAEPTKLVDKLMEDLSICVKNREALVRQNARYFEMSR